MRSIIGVEVLFVGAMALPVSLQAEGLEFRNTSPRQVIVEWPGGSARVTLVTAWGRTREPNKEWKTAGDKLPAVEAVAGENYVEIRTVGRPTQDERVRMNRFDVEFTGDGWSDPSGTRTWVRRGQWTTVAEASKAVLAARSKPSKTSVPPPGPTDGSLGRVAWPPASGLLRYLNKGISANDSNNDDWTGCLRDYFSPDVALPMVDESAILRDGPGGRIAGVVATRALGIAFEAADKFSIVPVVWGAKAGTDAPACVRICLAAGNPSELGARWVDAMETCPLRVFFSGDSVGAERGSYADILAGRVSSAYAGKVRCWNISCGGYTTASALAGFQRDVLDSRGNLVVFQLCCNDVLRIKPANVVANFRKMIAPTISQRGGRVVVLTPLSYDKKRVDDTLKAGTDINKVHTEDYIPALKTMVEEYQADEKTKGRVGFVNIWDAMAKVRAEKGADYVLLPDGSHPNAECHKLIADAVWPELKRMAGASLEETEEKR
jgi:lysophospholipase L1-like esterase